MPEEDTEAPSILSPIARLSVVDAVADRLRGEILAGRLEAGARLPSERELALALGVNRLTLRAALGRLEALGLISTRHGAGSVVASWRERAGLEALPALAGVLSPRDEAWQDMLVSILEVRRVLAAEAVALAAVRHSPYDLAMMKERAAEQAARVHDPIALARGDLAFMRAVIRAARNVGLELILNSFARFPDEHPALVAALWDDPQRTLEYYPLVIMLVEQGDPVVARDAVRSALEHVDMGLVARARERAGLAPATGVHHVVAEESPKKKRRKGKP